MKTRVLTALALAIPCLAILAWPGIAPIGLLASAVALIGAYEAGKLLRFDGLPRRANPTLVSAVAFILAISLSGTEIHFVIHDKPVLVAAFAVAATLFGIAGAYWGEKKPMAAYVAGYWIFSPLLALVAIHQMESTQTWTLRNPILLAMLPIWAGDIAGIFAGKAFGKHPLAPTISPKKTVEGSIANALAALITGALLGLWLPQGPAVGAACGLTAGTLGQTGDLFESFLKRRAGVKDSGALLPGHGGILDRIDSLLFAAPAVLLIVAAFH
ncbi:phosphatidate cytidylyltransferase [soil metagenome]